MNKFCKFVKNNNLTDTWTLHYICKCLTGILKCFLSLEAEIKKETQSDVLPVAGGVNFLWKTLKKDEIEAERCQINPGLLLLLCFFLSSLCWVQISGKRFFKTLRWAEEDVAVWLQQIKQDRDEPGPRSTLWAPSNPHTREPPVRPQPRPRAPLPRNTSIPARPLTCSHRYREGWRNMSACRRLYLTAQEYKSPLKLQVRFI